MADWLKPCQHICVALANGDRTKARSLDPDAGKALVCLTDSVQTSAFSYDSRSRSAKTRLQIVCLYAKRAAFEGLQVKLCQVVFLLEGGSSKTSTMTCGEDILINL